MTRHLLFLLLGAAPAAAAPVATLPLNDGWQARIAPVDRVAIAAHPREARPFAAHVPGSIQQDLLAAGRVPDPFKGLNEAAIQWVGGTGWDYRRRLAVSPALLARGHVDLVFEGLDTFATVTVNGHELLRADNAFRRWRIAAKPWLHVGDNEIVVAFAAPVPTVQPTVLAAAHPLPGNYDSAFGDEPKGRQTSPYVRKPQYGYGWDWGPRLLTIGLWRPVRLETWDDLRIERTRVDQQALNDAEARLVVDVDVRADRTGSVTVRATAEGPDGASVEGVQQAQVAAGVTRVSVPLVIPHPRRWQPAGYGAQPLYRVTSAIERDGVRLDAGERRIGLRTVSLIRDGGAMGFRVNGVPVFAKGANLIPFDSFPARVTPAAMRPLLQAARDANMNMLRVWGGGTYLDDAFYDMADELGLMVWQDFMFGGGVPPPDPAFRANVAAEAEEQVERLNSHPSIVLWSGGNEILAGWDNWSDRKAFKQAVGPDEQERVGVGLALLFDRTLRDAVAANASGTPYWANSPSDDYQGPVDTDAAGDRHFWDVWSGSQPVERYTASCPRFMSEYGFQSAPDLATIRGFAGDGPRAPDDPVMRAHQKFLAGAGNDRLLLYMRQRLGEPRDLADFVYLSQVNQAQAIALAALHHRACRPVTMGSLYWQLNDVWPGLSWSSIDHDGHWKLLHYAARRFFAPQAVVAEHRDGATRVTLVSDATVPLEAHWRLRAFNMAGRLLARREADVTLVPLSATQVASLPDADLFAGAAPAASYAVADLAVNGREASRTVVERLVPRNMAYPDPGLSARWDGDRLTVSARALARAVMLDFGTVAAHPSDNGFDLLPGESRTVTVAAQSPPARLAQALTLRSLGSRR